MMNLKDARRSSLLGLFPLTRTNKSILEEETMDIQRCSTAALLLAASSHERNFLMQSISNMKDASRAIS
jgi:hypothetical protein